MSRHRRWKESEIVDGVGSVHITSWKYFHDYIISEMLDYNEYVYRGHRCDNWLLEPTLDRILRSNNLLNSSAARAKHLKRFQYAARGRRGPNPANLNNDNDWWAIGQHHGLATPLLDWSTSPFVAAFFAFEKSENDDTEHRVIYAAHERLIIKKSTDLKSEMTKRVRPKPQLVEFFRPLSDENARLVNQNGLLSRTPDGIDLETWVKKQFKGEKSYILMKIFLPNHSRIGVLRTLNRMNINHLSLFPDLSGSCLYCNTDIIVDKY